MNEIKRSRICAAILVGVLLVLLLVGGAAYAQPAGVLSLSRSVIGGGGGQSENGEYRLAGTVGQGVAGSSEVASHQVCAGFWCGLVGYELYLPLILR